MTSGAVGGRRPPRLRGPRGAGLRSAPLPNVVVLAVVRFGAAPTSLKRPVSMSMILMVVLPIDCEMLRSSRRRGRHHSGTLCNERQIER
jgi:hypothetical protein